MVADGGVDAETLGRATWTFLHTLAATFPQTPTAAEQARMKRFMNDFSDIYPCEPCAYSFREIMKAHPTDTTTGHGFAQWMCRVHNEVNKELGKTSFDCSKVSDRWGICEQCAAHKDKLEDFKSMFKGLSKVKR